MICGGQEVCSHINYILGTDLHLFQNMAFQDAWHNTDHYLVLECLRRAAPAKHLRYLMNRKRFPLKPQKTLGGVYRLFAELRGDIPKPPRRERPRQ